MRFTGTSTVLATTLFLVLAGNADGQISQLLVTACCVPLPVASPTQQCFQNPANGHWYSVLPTGRWEDVEQAAADLGGHIVAIEDIEEANWLMNTFGRDRSFWIGLRDLDGQGSWVWTNGEEVTFAPWVGGQPNDDVLAGWILNPGNQHYYTTTPGSHEWLWCEAWAQHWGAHLVSVNTVDEQMWLDKTFGKVRPNWWIGLTMYLDEWTWTSGEPVTFTRWDSGEPSGGDYVFMSGSRWDAIGPESPNWGDVEAGIVEVESAEVLGRLHRAIMNAGKPGEWADVVAHSNVRYPAIVEFPGPPQETEEVCLSGRLSVHVMPYHVRDIGARWRVDGGAWLHPQAQDIVDLQSGYHTVEFKPIDGWQEPAELVVDVLGGETVVREASYTPLAAHAIGDIPPQAAWHGRTLRFIVESPNIGGITGTVWMETGPGFSGSIEFHHVPGIGTVGQVGQFSYTPAPEDKEPFEVTFLDPRLSQTITITPMAHLVPEQTVLTYQRPLPDPESRDYIVVSEIANPNDLFNHIERPTRNVTISGVRVVFEENSTKNALHEFSDSEDIKEMVICAETLVIRCPLKLPQTNVTIHARELRFEDPEDKEPGWAHIDTIPKPYIEIAGELQEGAQGLQGGAVAVHAERFTRLTHCGASPCFVLRGGKGQKAGPGRDGANGLDMPMNRFLWDIQGPPGEYVLTPTYVVCIVDEDGQATWGRKDWPTDGEPAIAPKEPGIGGKGGDFSSTLAATVLDWIVDNSGGPAGEKAADAKGGRAGGPPGVTWFRERGPWWKPGDPLYEFHVSEVWASWMRCPEGLACRVIEKRPPTVKGPDAAAPQAASPFGPSGTPPQMIPQHYSWLHPLALERILSYLRDAYIAGHPDYVRQRCSHYLGILDPFEHNFTGDLRDDFEQLKQGLEVLRAGAAQNLDYFGYPPGWVPMLSFEANKIAFETEVEKAFPLLYVTYWLSNKAQQAEDRLAALGKARDQIRGEIQDQKERFNELQEILPGLASELEDVAYLIEHFKPYLVDKERELIRRAEQNVWERHQLPWWKKALRVLGGVLQVLPVVQPVSGGVGVGMEFISQVDPEDPLTSLWEGRDILEDFDAEALEEYAVDFNEAIEGADMNDLETFKPLWETLKDNRKNFERTFAKITDALKERQAPRSEVDAELAKLQAEDTQFQDLVRTLDALNDRKQSLAERIAVVSQGISELSTSIQANVLAVDAIHANLTTGLNGLDPRVASIIKEVELRQRDRLLKYQYYLIQAYHYRMLEPYDGDLSLLRLFDELRQMVIVADGGYDPKPEDYEKLKSIYTEELQHIAADIWKKLNENAPEKSNYISFGLTPEELRKLNDEDKVTINLFDRRPRIFSRKWENLRIFKLNVEELLVHPEGGPYGSTALMFLSLEHSGVSRLSSGGDTYLFRHYKGGNVSPIAWDIVYHGIPQEYYESEPSAAQVSLLRHLLDLEKVDYDEEDIMLYSRPAAWADIVISKEVSTAPGVDMIIDSLQLKVRVDYYSKPTDRADLAVDVLGDIMPDIFVGTPDLNGRQDGRGDFRRAFHRYQRVTLNGQPFYGRWEFVKWADDDGDLAFEPTVEIGMDDHKHIYATYTLPDCYPECRDDYLQWVAAGKPECWCYPRQCHGDVDDLGGGSEKTGYYYVGPNDLNVLLNTWLVKEPPHGPGIASVPHGICADFAHDVGGSEKTGFYSVGPSDLNILITNWLKKEPPHGPGIVPDCLDCP